MISLIIISMTTIIQIPKEKFSNFMVNIWRYSSLILSEPYPTIAYRRINQFLWQRIILSVWLLSCTVLLSGFSGVLLGSFMKSLPNNVIDSYAQLFQRNHLKIITTKTNYFYSSLSKEKSFKYFKDNLIETHHIPLGNLSHPIMIDYTDKVRKGTHVMIVNKSILNSILTNTKCNKTIQIMKEFYLSKYGIGQYLYGLYLSHRNRQLSNDVNNL
jgi:hypothetical protein